MFYTQQSLDMCILTISGTIKFKVLSTATYRIVNHTKMWIVQQNLQSLDQAIQNFVFLSWKYKPRKRISRTISSQNANFHLKNMEVTAVYEFNNVWIYNQQNYVIYIFFFHGATALIGRELITVESWRSHCVRHTKLGSTSLDEWLSHRR